MNTRLFWAKVEKTDSCWLWELNGASKLTASDVVTIRASYYCVRCRKHHIGHSREMAA